MQLDDTTNHHGKKKLTFRSFVKEIRVFLILFFVVMAVMLVVTNIKLFTASFQSLFWWDIQQIQDIKKYDATTNSEIALLLEKNPNDPELLALAKKYQTNSWSSEGMLWDMENLLGAKLKEYPFDFNTLPPVNKIMISKIWLDAPIVAPTSMTAEDFIKANFDEELTQWVVKYPTTPDPWATWNSLIFWHTSQEFRQKNPYGTIFRNIPKLANGDTIKIIWEGNLYEYRIVDKFVVLPSQVNTQYMSYQNAGGSYITLMGCYPLGTDKKRIMVVAKMVE